MCHAGERTGGNGAGSGVLEIGPRSDRKLFALPVAGIDPPEEKAGERVAEGKAGLEPWAFRSPLARSLNLTAAALSTHRRNEHQQGLLTCSRLTLGFSGRYRWKRLSRS